MRSNGRIFNYALPIDYLAVQSSTNLSLVNFHVGSIGRHLMYFQIRI